MLWREYGADWMMWLVIIITFLGLIVGKIISYYTKDEYDSGLKYFKLLEKVLIGLLVVVLLFSKLSLILFLYILIGIIIGVFIREIYLFLSIALLSVLFLSNEIILLVASLIFFFGIVYASVRKIEIKNIILNGIVFFIPFVLLLTKSFINTNLTIFLGVSIGGLLAQLGRAPEKFKLW